MAYRGDYWHTPGMKSLFSVLMAAATASAVLGAGLVDHPIAGDTVTYLDGADWGLSSPTVPVGTKTVSVPGDLISDLFNAGVIDEPLFELNFKNATIWDQNVWTYSKAFTATPAMLAALSKATPSCTSLRFVVPPAPLLCPPTCPLRARS